MKLLSCAAFVSLSIAGLAGCASMDDELTRSGPAADQTMTAEEIYIAKVERIARRRGIEVVWVNPPEAAPPALVATR